MASRSLTQALAALMLLLPASLVGCERGANAPATIPVTIEGETFTLEVAADDASRERGLAGRESIPPDGGMIFIFPRAEQRRFWMRGCVSDIDIMFLDGRGFITALHEMKAEPLRRDNESESEYLARLQGYESNYPAQFAIELAPGTLDRLDLQFQDKIDLDVERLKRLAR